MARSYHVRMDGVAMRDVLDDLGADRYGIRVDPASTGTDGWTDTVGADDLAALLDGEPSTPPWTLHLRDAPDGTHLSASTYAPSRNGGAGAVVSLDTDIAEAYDAVVARFRD